MAKKLYGTDPDQVPTNADLGTIAYQDSENVNLVKDSGAALTINRKTDNGDLALFRKDGSTVGRIQSRAGLVSTIILDPRSGQGAGITGAGAGGDTTRFMTPTDENGSEINGKVSLGNSANAFRDLYLSGGVVFGDAGGSGTSSSNTFDSYEEGYGVSAFTTTGGSVTINSSFNRIFYTKVGRQVSLSGRISVASVSSPTGLLQITIPFTCANLDHDCTGAVYLAVNGIASGDIGDFWAEIPEGGNKINVYRTGSNNVSNSAAGFMVSGSDIRILASYIAA